MEMPKANQRVELRVLSGPHASTYSTYVEESDQQSIVVIHPWVGNQPISVLPGDRIRLEFGMKGYARIAIPTRVLKLATRGMPVLILSFLEQGEPERYQQRDYIRLNTSLPLAYQVQKQSGEMQTKESYPSKSRDISGSGMQMLCAVEHPIATKLAIRLDLGDRELQVVGEVVRAIEVTAQGRVWMGVRFNGIQEGARDMIIRYIFQEQLERRRRGLM